MVIRYRHRNRFTFILFFLYFSPLLSFLLAQLPLLLLLSCSSSLIRGIHPPLGSTTPPRIHEDHPTAIPILPARSLFRQKKEKKRSPMRQRRWKRRRSDIFTDFTQPLQKPFSLSRAWKAVSWKLREPVGSYEWEPGCYLIAKIPGNIPVSGWNLRLTRDR